jgi:NADH dehydrogenase FAD-containing subunit
LEKNEVYMVEEDYFNRANVEVIAGDVKTIDLNTKKIIVRGIKNPIDFDKVLIAWGSFKKRL